MKTHYERFLPHRLPPGAALFVTFRLAESLPQSVIAQLQAERELARQSAIAPQSPADRYREQKRHFARFDAQLDAAAIGPVWLRQSDIAEVVKEAMFFRDGSRYKLICFCIMANRVHMVVQLADDAPSFMRTLQSLKANTALQCNRLLGRQGQFWHFESYDHVVRDGAEMQHIVAYVLENPIKAGLVTDWREWPHTYWSSAH